MVMDIPFHFVCYNIATDKDDSINFSFVTGLALFSFVVILDVVIQHSH